MLSVRRCFYRLFCREGGVQAFGRAHILRLFDIEIGQNRLSNTVKGMKLEKKVQNSIKRYITVERPVERPVWRARLSILVESLSQKLSKPLLSWWREIGVAAAQQILAEVVEGDWSSSGSVNPC